MNNKVDADFANEFVVFVKQEFTVLGGGIFHLI
jgi:hypothetical protein